MKDLINSSFDLYIFLFLRFIWSKQDSIKEEDIPKYVKDALDIMGYYSTKSKTRIQKNEYDYHKLREERDNFDFVLAEHVINHNHRSYQPDILSQVPLSYDEFYEYALECLPKLINKTYHYNQLAKKSLPVYNDVLWQHIKANQLIVNNAIKTEATRHLLQTISINDLDWNIECKDKLTSILPSSFPSSDLFKLTDFVCLDLFRWSKKCQDEFKTKCNILLDDLVQTVFVGIKSDEVLYHISHFCGTGLKYYFEPPLPGIKGRDFKGLIQSNEFPPDDSMVDKMLVERIRIITKELIDNAPFSDEMSKIMDNFEE